MNKINLILGTMQFGERIFGKDAQDMIETFGELGFSELDTAYVYNEGQSELLIGKSLENLSKEFKIATKVNPRSPNVSIISWASFPNMRSPNCMVPSIKFILFNS